MARTMGYVPQMEGRSFPSTVFDAILLGRRPHIQWAPSESDLRKVSEVIDLLRLEDIALRDINRLSGGQRQKVIIGRALAQEPKILLLDEPTANLDLRHQMEVMDIVKEQSRQGMMVLMSIHDLNLAARYCERIIMLQEGRVFAAGGREVLTPETIRSVYGIDVEVIRHGETDLIVPL
jgi:iron complex transport system ATP-binding protein